MLATLENDIKKAIISNYGFTEIKRLTSVHKGFCQCYSFFSDNKKFFLKIYPLRGDNSRISDMFYESVFKVRTALVEHRVPMLLPLKTNNQNEHTKIGFHFVEIYKYIEHSHSPPTPDGIMKSARILTHMHQAPIKAKSARRLGHLFVLFNKFTNLKPLSTTNIQFFVKQAEEFANKQTFVNCHGDYNTSNIIIQEKKVFILDFDSFIFAPKIFDLANMLFYLMDSFVFGEKCFLFFKEYCSVNSLAPEEKAMIPCFMILHRLEQFCGAVKSKDTAKALREVSTIKKLIERHEEYKARCLSLG